LLLKLTLANYFLGEEEIEHKKKKRKIKFVQEESSASEVSRSDAAKEDEPSITTDQEEHNNRVQIGSGVPGKPSAANLFSRLFSLISSGNNEAMSGYSDGQLIFSPDIPPGYEPFDENEEDQFDDEELYEFNDDNLGLYQNANADHELSEQEEFPRLNNNSDSVEGDEDINDEGLSKSRKRSRDLNSNESESEPKRKRANNSGGNRIFSSTTKLM